MYAYVCVCTYLRMYACMYLCMNVTINLMNLKKRLKQKIILIKKTLKRFFCCLLDSCLIKESKKK